MLASHLSGHCGVISNRLWRHQQNVNRASERVDVTWHNEFINNDKNDDVHHRFLSSFIDSLCRVSYKIKYVLSWRTAHALTRVSFPSRRERINSSPLEYKSMHYIYIYIYIYVYIRCRGLSPLWLATSQLRLKGFGRDVPCFITFI